MSHLNPLSCRPPAAAKFTKLLLAVACAASVASCAAAAPANEVWRCSTPNGTFDRFEMPISPETREFSGEMIFHKANFGRWGPVASVGFQDSSLDSAGCKCNGIKVTPLADYPDVINVFLMLDGHDLDLGSVPYDKPVTFKFSIGELNEVKLEVGTGVKIGVPHHAALDTLKLSCSSADVSFRNIKTK